MENNSNFKRANTIINEWPSWKKEYKLTTHSSQHESNTQNGRKDPSNRRTQTEK